MAINVMLSVDLHGASTQQRNEFNEYLFDKGWLKMQVDTVWTYEYKELGFETAKKFIKSCVVEAAQIAKVKYDALALVCMSDGLFVSVIGNEVGYESFDKTGW
ncbi:hypothetical protein SN11_16890 [Vibrio harveyi]|nr:hypothetical protein SN11_16890 [Vibrio harveyi]